MRAPPLPPSEGGFSEPGDSPAKGEPQAPAQPQRYAVGALLGSGGMGVVYVARDRPLGRDVALKELRPELAPDELARRRLAREAAITSRLDHPNIVSVHDLGELPDGRPYYTMRLVRGRSLAAAIRAARTEAQRRALIRCVLAAAEAVAAAHDAGVVHRDLKPANILLGPHGETQVVDWGLATPIADAAERWADLGPEPVRGPVGTLAYMSPEQQAGALPSPRLDVYSLGVTLGEVVGPDGAGPEIAAIIARATTPDPAARYPHAGAFAADLLAWFEGRRVAAYSYTAADLVRRAMDAYGLPIGVAGVGLAAVLVASTVGWWQTSRSLDRALEAEARAADALAEIQLEQAVAATKADDRERAERLAWGVLTREEDPLARGVLAAFGRSTRPERISVVPGPSCRWSALSPAGDWVLCGEGRAVSRWDGGERRWTVPADPSGRGVPVGDVVLLWEATRVHAVLDAATGEPLPFDPLVPTDWRPLRPPFATWGADGLVREGLAPPTGCEKSLIASDALGERLAGLCEDGTLVLVDRPGQARRIPTEVIGDHVGTTLRFTPSGDLVAGTLRGRAVLFDGATGATLARVDTDLGEIVSVRVDPAGRHAALGGSGGGVGVWRLADGHYLGQLGTAEAFAFSSDGLVLFDGQLTSWRLPEGGPRLIHTGAGLSEVAVATDGRTLITVGGGGWTERVDLATGERVEAGFGGRVVKCAAHGPSGWVVGGMDVPHVARLGEDGWHALAEARPLRRVAVMPDGAVYGVQYSTGLCRWTAPEAPLERVGGDAWFGDLDRDGDRLFVLDDAGDALEVVGDALVARAHLDDARAIAHRAGWLVLAAEDEIVAIHDGGERREVSAPGANLLDVAVSDDGRHVAAGGLDGLVRVWDVETAQLIGVLPGHEERVVSVKFLPNGDLATASWDRSARLWAVAALTRPRAEVTAELAAAWELTAPSRSGG